MDRRFHGRSDAGCKGRKLRFRQASGTIVLPSAKSASVMRAARYACQKCYRQTLQNILPLGWRCSSALPLSQRLPGTFTTAYIDHTGGASWNETSTTWSSSAINSSNLTRHNRCDLWSCLPLDHLHRCTSRRIRHRGISKRRVGLWSREAGMMGVAVV